MDKDIDIEKLTNRLAEYKGKELETTVQVLIEANIINEGLGPIPGVFFYYKSASEDYKFKRCISPLEVHRAIANYVESLNFDLVDCKYLGGIRRADLIKGPDEPYFDGLKLQVQERGLARLLNKSEQ